MEKPPKEAPPPVVNADDEPQDVRRSSISVLQPEQRIEPLKTNFLSWFTMLWIVRFVRYFSAPASKTRAPIVALHQRELAANAHDRLDRHWQEEIAAARTGQKAKPSMLHAIWRAFGWRYVFIGIWKLINNFCIYFAAYYLLRSLILFVLNNEPSHVGYLLVFGLFLCAAGQTFSLNHMQAGALSVGLEVKGALSSMIFRKMFRTKEEPNLGVVSNLIASDCQRILNGIVYGHYLWSSVMEVIIIIALLAAEIGVSCLPGIGVLLISVPLQCMLGIWTGKRQTAMQEHSDRRLKLMSSMIDAIKVVKYNTWERFFSQEIYQLRKQELDQAMTITHYRSVGFCNSFTTPVLVALACFALQFVRYGINPVTSFTVLSIANSLRYPFFVLPTTTKSLSSFWVSLKHVTDYLLSEQVTHDAIDNQQSTTPKIVAEDVSFTWDRAAAKPALSNVSFSLQGPQLMCVVGSIASGKSTLFAGLLQQLDRVAGKLEVVGRTGYVSQYPWLYMATLRDNILFGQKYDARRYREVIRVCALERDLEILPDGDQTMIAERGTNLSGGQRQRVNLARAVYSNYDIMLFDDTLSAVDQKVGRFIFKECMRGFLRDKIVILITHQLQYTEDCENVLVLHDGRQVQYGPYTQLYKEEGVLKQMLGLVVHEPGEVDDKPTGGSEPAPKPTPADAEITRVKMRQLTMLKPLFYVPRDKTTDAGEAAAFKQWIAPVATLPGAFFLVVLFLGAHCIRLASDTWITSWTSNAFASTTGFYVGIYAVYVFAFGAFILCRGMIFSSITIQTARVMHDRLLGRTLHATMDFFQRTPLARLVNAFGPNMAIVDDLLPESMLNILQFVPLLLGALALIMINNYWTVIPCVAVWIIVVPFAKFTNPSIEVLSQQESLAQPHALSHVTASVQGVQTIKAFKCESQFIETFEGRMNRLHNFTCALFNVQTWLALQLDTIASLLIFIVGILCVLYAHSIVTAALMGLIMSNAMQLIVFVKWVNRDVAETRARVPAVLTSEYYATMPPIEANFKVIERTPPREWPEHGEISFDNAVLHYNKEGPPVLKDVTLHIKGGEKIGIVGRTGAGKSTLLNSLLRMYELSEGTITLDGVNVATIGLHDLRDKVGVIPQEPVLFVGTIESNLDPFDEYSKQQLWEVLRMIRMDEFVRNCPLQLQHPVLEYGANLSLGQRQLLCFARALLKKVRILIMDEATASIDSLTDNHMQAVVRKVFHDCTVLTIAHRLNTVIDYDRIIVMERGCVLEYDEPHVLLQRPDSSFSALVDQTGPSTAAMLRQKAKEASERRAALAAGKPYEGGEMFEMLEDTPLPEHPSPPIVQSPVMAEDVQLVVPLQPSQQQ